MARPETGAGGGMGPRPQALVDGAMLGIDGHDLSARRRPCPLHDRRAGDQRLLVGERQPATRGQCGERDREPCEPDHRVNDHVAELSDLRQRLRARQHLGARRDPARQLLGETRVGDRHDLWS